jgi:hypothetical protein
MTFFNEMAAIRDQLEKVGIRVVIPAIEEVKIDYTASSDEELSRVKKQFIDGHLAEIERSEAVLIANFDKHGVKGYVGANTLMEAAFAYVLRKPIYVLHLLGPQSCKPELLGLQPRFLGGVIDDLVSEILKGEQDKTAGPLDAPAA